MKIAQRMHRFHRLQTGFIRRAGDVAPLHAATGQPERHGRRVVIATPDLTALADAVVGAAPELASPNDQCLVQQAGTLQVFHQRRHAFVDRAHARAVGLLNVVVRIPAHGDHLHESNALLDQAPRQQAAAAERVGVLVRPADAVHRQRFRGLLRYVHYVRHLGLHAKGQFVAFDARGQVRVLGMALAVDRV